MSKNFQISLIAVFVVSVSAFATTRYVPSGGSPSYANIQDAINAAEYSGDTIIVMPGTYTENISFNGKALTLTSNDPNDTNIVQTTIITADSGYSVTFEFGEGSDSILTGFTITGCGIRCSGCSPTIRKNVIRDCSIWGIRGDENARPTASIIYNTITNNGAGIFFCDGLISYNTINNNSEVGLYDCDGTISHNTITGNITPGQYGKGGGLRFCDGTISHNIITGNIAGAAGGGLSECGGIIINNTICGNVATSSGVNSYGGGLYWCETAIVKNNIIAFNESPTGGGIYGSCNNSYNAFWMNDRGNFGGGASAGIGDIVNDPLFINSGYWDGDTWVKGDYHLKSEAGRWDSTTSTWEIDDVTSQCIDIGDPCEPVGAEPNPNGGRINMGVYGGTGEASKSTSGIVEPICTEYPAMDFNDDCKVDFQDFAIFSQSWLECNLDPPEACWE